MKSIFNGIANSRYWIIRSSLVYEMKWNQKCMANDHIAELLIFTRNKYDIKTFIKIT